MSSLENALEILGLLNPKREVLRVSEVARDLDIPKSSVSRLLQTMCASGLLEREEAGQGYLAGPLSLTLGTLYRNRFSAVDDADRIVTRLIAQFGFTGYVSCLSEDVIVLLRVRQGSYPLRHVRDVGTKLPAFKTAMGLTLLSDLPLDECKRRFDLAPRDGLSWEGVAGKLEALKQDGVIVAESVLTPGIITISALARHHCLEERVAVAIGFPENAADAPMRETIARELLEGASFINAKNK
ncbi:MAG: hypothetical protein BGP06_03560 [Rhizobiales bacterium 65-9]|nr:IclR family transcriptional regulator [Hyphomicrobiales bacterium]OJY32770.1 MAG: hypothetical protein BGP06_03560 [Rhizobiales bacterium 65-9]